MEIAVKLHFYSSPEREKISEQLPEIFSFLCCYTRTLLEFIVEVFGKTGVGIQIQHHGVI